MGCLAFSMRTSFVERGIFQPTRDVELAPEDVGLRGEDVFLDTEDGVRIHAYWLPAPAADRAILFLHGNAGNASHRLPNAAALVGLACHVLLLDYRGYGRSEGKPSEQGSYRDARAALDHLLGERGIPADRVVIFGRSLGGAVAVDLAQGRALAGVVLESTFTSAGAVARTIFGRPAAWLMGNRFDSAGKIADLRSPLLFFHGDRDDIVPFELGQQLFELAPEPKAFETIRGAGHNDTVMVGGRAYLERFRQFLDHVAP